jgi:plasmid stabilization system protein ParE
MIVISLQARADLREIHGYIARENAAAADRELARIAEALSLLSAGSVDGREVVLRDGRRVRVWLVASYRLYYRRTGKRLQVVRVYHQARRPMER